MAFYTIPQGARSFRLRIKLRRTRNLLTKTILELESFFDILIYRVPVAQLDRAADF